MNKIKKYILSLGIIALVASCSDSFLDVVSKTESTTGTFYKTMADANRALIGCYDGLQRTVSEVDQPFWLISNMMADECYGGTGNADGLNYRIMDRFDQTWASYPELLESQWRVTFASVYRCNELISRQDDIEWTDDATKGLYIGQARAIRAMVYFDAVRMFGNIPLFLEPVNENKPQVAPSEVFEAILADLKYAAANIPENAFPKAQAATNDGRITCWAAKALLARVYLFYTGRYGAEPAAVTKTEVLAGLEDFIGKSNTLGYGLVAEFKNLWPAASSPGTCTRPASPRGSVRSDFPGTTYAGDGNRETVLAIKCNFTDDWGRLVDGNRALVMVGFREMNPAPYGSGWGACSVPESVYSNWPLGDTRRDASIVNHAIDGVASHPEYNKSVGDTREYTGYSTKKYIPLAYATADGMGLNAVDGLGAGNMQISNYQDIVVMRYADVLLMAAELGSPSAQSYLDQVRARAWNNGSDTPPTPPAVTVSKENIMKERQYEFAFESQRYWDLVRQGVNVAADAIAASGGPARDGGAPIMVTFDRNKIIEKQGYAQIPNNQIILSNGVLKQNPGW